MLTSFQCNGIELIAPNGQNGVFLQYPIDGLDAPSYRVSSYDKAGQDGSVLTTPFYGVRTVTITGKLAMNQGAALYESARKLLLAAFGTNRDTNGNIIKQTYQFTTLAGTSYFFYGQAKTPVFGIAQMAWTQFKVDILVPESYLSQLTSGNSTYVVQPGDILSGIATAKGLSLIQIEQLNPQITNPNVITVGQILNIPVPQTTGHFSPPKGGGFNVPTNVPIITTLTGTGSVTANNTGNIISPPLLYLFGSLTTPYVVNSTTGISIQIAYTLAATDVVVIDMKNKTIVLNGNTSLLGTKSTGSDWWGLVPGPNIISISSGNSADTGAAEIDWYNTVSGV